MLELKQLTIALELVTTLTYLFHQRKGFPFFCLGQTLEKIFFIIRVDWGKEPTLRTNARNFLDGLCIPEHYASKCVKESNQDKKQCYSNNIYNTKQLIKKIKLKLSVLSLVMGKEPICGLYTP